jgi:prefoldin subunit 5
MYTLYQKLNKKLDSLTKPTQTLNNTEKNTHTEQARLINLTKVTFTKEHINTLALGLNYALEKNPKYYK